MDFIRTRTHDWDLFKVVDHLENLPLWEVPDVVLDQLQGTGFENLAKIFNLRPSQREHLTPLISALVHLYDVDKRCFVFNGIDFFFGLEDILKISGLPIDGKPVIGPDGRDEEFAEKYLGVTRGNGVDFKAGGICLRSLRRKYGNSDCLSIQYIRAYVLYMIGCVIAPRSSLIVPGYFLALLEDVDKIKDYAWGAAMLTLLHKGLESAKNGRRKTLPGHSIFLMIFILEHIPKVVRQLQIDTNDMPSATFPLVLRWLDQLSKLTENNCSRPYVSWMLQLFGQLTHDEIIWYPYNGLSVPAPYNEQVPMGCSLTSILCMEKWVLHDPTLRADVDRPSESISLYREELIHVHSCTRQIYRSEKKNWCETSAEFLKHWDNRKDYLVNLIDAEEFVSQQQKFEGQEKDESPSIEAEKEVFLTGSPKIFVDDMPKPAINITKHSPAIHGSNHSFAGTVNCQKSVTGVVVLDDISSSSSPLSYDMDYLDDMDQDWNVLKIVDHVENLSLWEVPDVVLDRLQGTGFENLAKIFNLRPSRHEHLTTLISALVHFYDVDKRCFMFNGLDLFFGLEDILKISGLPIDGKPVIGQDGRDEEFAEKYLGVTREEYFGVTSGNGIDFKTGGICLRSLRRKYGNSDCLNSQYIRAYVLYIIGSVIAPRTNFAVPGYFLALLEDVDKIKDYAWGAAMLAYLHRGLESAKNDRRTTLPGHSLFLMIFILEHIPKVVRKLNIDTNGMPSATFPLVLRWLDQLRKLNENDSSRMSVSRLRQLLDQLTHNEIIWSPYNGLFVPSPYNEQVPMGYSLTSILCMENWALHDPTLRTDVDCPSEKISLYREKLLRVHRCTKLPRRCCTAKKNWCEENATFLKHWNHRKDYLVNLIDAGDYVSQQQKLEGQGEDESMSKKAEREVFLAGSLDIFANDMPKHSPAFHGPNHSSAETLYCKKFDVILDVTSSSTSPLSFDNDATPLSSLRKTRTRSEAAVDGDSGGDCFQIDEVEQFFARLPAQLRHAKSSGNYVNSPALKKPRYSAEVPNKSKVEVQNLLMMPLHKVLLPVNFSTLMAALPRYAESPGLSVDEIHDLKELKENLQSLFVDFHTAKKQHDECNSKAHQKVILMGELIKGQEHYSNLKQHLNELDTSTNSIRSQILDLKESLKEAEMKKRTIQEEGLNLKNTLSAKLSALKEMEAEFLDLKKELADSQISKAEVSWANYKQKLSGLGL